LVSGDELLDQSKLVVVLPQVKFNLNFIFFTTIQLESLTSGSRELDIIRHMNGVSDLSPVRKKNTKGINHLSLAGSQREAKVCTTITGSLLHSSYIIILFGTAYVKIDCI
jgi:hypothetical protein